MTGSDELALIDVHTHTQPTLAATEAFMANLGMPAATRGTPADLLARMNATNIDWTMIVSFIPAQDFVARAVKAGADRETAIAAVLADWHDLNSWAAAVGKANPDRFKCVVGVDPILMSPQQVSAEVATQLAAGASGIKIAPMFLDVQPDDEAMEIVWQLAVQHDVPVLSESGAGSYEGHAAWGHPRHFEQVLSSYPTLRLQLAHLGQGAEQDMARLVRGNNNVLTDTALRFGGMAGLPVDAGDAVELIRLIGVEHVAFGTNYPIVDQGEYAAALRASGLSPSELRLVGHDNAARFWAVR